MACLHLDYPQGFLHHQSYDGLPNSPQLYSDQQSFDVSSSLQFEDEFSLEFLSVPNDATSSLSYNIPKPPLPPNGSCGKNNVSKWLIGCDCILDERRHAWDRLFYEGYQADVQVVTDDEGLILAHSNVLGVTSAVLRSMLERENVKAGFRCINIHGVPSGAARAFIRFLYSSCYESEDMKRYVLHLLVMSHSFAVPSLKRMCISQLEQALLTTENVIDVLQLARQCDAPRLSMTCIRMIVRDFKTISVSEGWKVMKLVNPRLEQELLEALVEADSRRQEKLRKMEERKVYLQLYEAMEALLHICKDGCRTIGPRDKMLNYSQGTCSYSACKVIESLVRHFSGCKARVPGGCRHCKRMWQLLELHSRMCSEPDLCKVPLCRHFKEKMKNQNKKEEAMWKLLVRKVMAAKGTISSISAWRLLAA